ncbi:MAG TPA: ACT domain-containing protein [Nocardioidaceae bacterium]|nr:ACT domain-containing protein [Nocardioidaceae bacterium]
MSFLLRVALPDVPGALGTVASAIGTAGANIEAIEIVEHRDDGSAVDDVLLELPTGVMPDSVVSACHLLDGVEVLWISRYVVGGNLQLDLEAVEALTEEPKAAVTHLVDLLPTVFRAEWGALLEPDGDAARVVNATSAAPGLEHLAGSWVRLDQPTRLEMLDAGVATLVVGAPVGAHGRSVVMGRRGGPEFLDSELARLAHLAALAATIARG